MKNRICIYPKDVCIITGNSYSYATKIIRTIKKYLGKKSHQALTIREFSEYMGLEFEEVYAEITGQEYNPPKSSKKVKQINSDKSAA